MSRPGLILVCSCSHGSFCRVLFLIKAATWENSFCPEVPIKTVENGTSFSPVPWEAPSVSGTHVGSQSASADAGHAGARRGAPPGVARAGPASCRPRGARLGTEVLPSTWETPVEWGSPPARRPRDRGPALLSVPRASGDRRTRPPLKALAGEQTPGSHSVCAQVVRVAERATLPAPALTPCQGSQHRTQPPKPRPEGRVGTPPLSVTHIKAGTRSEGDRAARVNGEAQRREQRREWSVLRAGREWGRRHRALSSARPVCRCRPVPRRCPLPAARRHRAHGAGGGGPGLQRRRDRGAHPRLPAGRGRQRGAGHGPEHPRLLRR